jgi:hypothetical protein
MPTANVVQFGSSGASTNKVLFTAANLVSFGCVVPCTNCNGAFINSTLYLDIDGYSNNHCGAGNCESLNGTWALTPHDTPACYYATSRDYTCTECGAYTAYMSLSASFGYQYNYATSRYEYGFIVYTNNGCNGSGGTDTNLPYNAWAHWFGLTKPDCNSLPVSLTRIGGGNWFCLLGGTCTMYF